MRLRGHSVTGANRRRRGSRPGPASATVVFSDGRRYRSPASQGSPLQEHLPAYSKAVKSYEALIQEIRANLDSSRQAALDFSLQDIRRLVPQQPKEEQLALDDAEANADAGIAAAPSPTYVGKASDIHFIHSIRQCVHGRRDVAEGDTPTQNYSQTHVLENPTILKHPLLFPSPAEADQFLDVYLSTIHIAYPFMPNSVLLDAFQRFKKGEVHEAEFRPWLAIFNFIFAIGSYYTSFPHGKHSSIGHHLRYYDQGLYYSRELSADCSLLSVWVLLVQCFFLLAVCHTDRCWNTLGFAIRMGQSIGLHVETCASNLSWMSDPNHRQRTWYSMPTAIHEADFQVELPSANDQSPFLSPNNQTSVPGGDLRSGDLMEYFLEVIRFSHIVGLVIQGLYRPSQVDLSPEEMLQSASSLDQRLFEWKMSLPRHLRFDLGHALEKNISFKRQSFMSLLLRDKERITEAEWICVHEAQETAHLLHNVVDERSLVHDFPWWQMISCLICASSILFVAECFHNNSPNMDGKVSAQRLREDAETCLKVFEALSVNSAAAQKAADMLGGLSRMRRSTEDVESVNVPSVLPPANLQAGVEPGHAGFHHAPEPIPSFPSPEMSAALSSLCEWPSEISNTMEWSVRFLDYPHFHPSDPPASGRGLR
ncbi:uncharacterized protein N7498_009206 [Penicillium cinerascens]|uniref:Xylanolytic transcriptional activator regulatory domain-containing protein n=1 Tax=Penicillium cinerascens TaxID=70096 RepID=A0A9W9J6P5_9EURO|nr:uncharacterized protein N7498_009206 [Penicillium cinerascens]KAJ5190221.1 hypothetical protein N7498_009206 [Penicillium cinerascens]